MFKKPVTGVGLFLALVSLATAGYLSQQKGSFTYNGGLAANFTVNDRTEVNLFNPSADHWVDYSLILPDGNMTGLLGPLASKRFDVNAETIGEIKLSADADLVAWKVIRNLDNDLETGRSTLPFINSGNEGSSHLFPWIQAYSGSIWNSGYVSVFNTSPFTASINYTVYDALTGIPTAEPSFVVSPFSSNYAPAVTNLSGHDESKYGVLWATNGASLLATYTNNKEWGTYSYWSEPTSQFSSLTFRPDVSDGDLVGDGFEPTVSFTRDESTSRDYLLFEGAGVSTQYLALNKELFTGFVGEVNGVIAQTGQEFNAAMTAPATGATATLEGADVVPGPGRYSGTLEVSSLIGYSPASMAVYSVDGDRSVAAPVLPVRERVVFPVDGSEDWGDQLSGSVFVLNNRGEVELPISVGLLDEGGNLLEVRYPTLEPGVTEMAVRDFVEGFPDTRTLLIESSRSTSFWSAHMMVTGSGSGFDGSMGDYVAPAYASGCGSFGLGPENFYNWGSGYMVPCEGQVASVLGLVNQVNQGNPPPYNN